MGFLFLLAALAASPAAASERLAGPYAAQVLRVIDGDTLEARVRVWLGVDVTVHVRLRGVNAPELRGPCAAAGRAARVVLAELVDGRPVILTEVGFDKYGGRVDAVVRLPTGEGVAERVAALAPCRDP